MHKRLYVYVTECSANKSGSLMKKNLDDIGIPCQVVLDASVGYVLEKVDLVLFGAEGVVESGGICNKVSIYSYTKIIIFENVNTCFFRSEPIQLHCVLKC